MFKKGLKISINQINADVPISKGREQRMIMSKQTSFKREHSDYELYSSPSTNKTNENINYTALCEQIIETFLEARARTVTEVRLSQLILKIVKGISKQLKGSVPYDADLKKCMGMKP